MDIYSGQTDYFISEATMSCSFELILNWMLFNTVNYMKVSVISFFFNTIELSTFRLSIAHDIINTTLNPISGLRDVINMLDAYFDSVICMNFTTLQRQRNCWNIETTSCNILTKFSSCIHLES